MEELLSEPLLREGEDGIRGKQLATQGPQISEATASKKRVSFSLAQKPTAGSDSSDEAPLASRTPKRLLSLNNLPEDEARDHDVESQTLLSHSALVKTQQSCSASEGGVHHVASAELKAILNKTSSLRHFPDATVDAATGEGNLGELYNTLAQVRKAGM